MASQPNPLLLNLFEKPLENQLVMAVVNVTHDSFYEESRCNTIPQLLKKIVDFRSCGASIIDIGACSTRPNSIPVTEEKELAELNDFLPALRNVCADLPISVDTFRGSVARRMVEEYNIDLLNDVYSFDQDTSLLKVLAEVGKPYVLTHHDDTSFITDMGDFMGEVMRFFETKLDILSQHGIKKVIIDPGYGFGKTMEQNFFLLTHQSVLTRFGLPILAGLSRKRMVWQTLRTTPEEALNGTSVLNLVALQQGASVLRVHDVAEAVEVVQLFKEMKSVSSL